MKRRDVLAWICRGMATTVAAVIGVPGVQYVLGSLKRAPAETARFRRVARLNDVAAGRPLLVPVMGHKQDAWTTHAEQPIGRVWLVRRDAAGTGDADEPPPGSIQALTSLCPHMGCHVQLRDKGGSFVCPCHRATFGLDGSKLPAERTGERNHAPRGMDELASRLVRDEASDEWWVEVKYEKFEPGLMQRVPKV
jgi:Rieske Fe-S protein